MPCLDEETLLAFADGSLDESGRLVAEAHIDECAACRQLLAQLAMDGSVAAVAARSEVRSDRHSQAVTVEVDRPPSLEAAALVRPSNRDAAVAVERGEERDSVQLRPGTLVDGTYRVRAPIGRGGMGSVYLALDERLDRLVALKLIKPEMLQSPGIAQRFIFEARVTARFSHPNIISVYGAGEVDGRPYLALEYVRGETLRERMNRVPAPSPDRIVSIALSLARALAEAHRYGVLHRDLKPSNVMVTADGRVRVLDFGLARLLEGRVPEPKGEPETDTEQHAGALELHHTRTGGVRGTPSYMAPEQWRGEIVTGAVDVWALGVMLFELTCGRYPFALALKRLATLREQIVSPEPVDVSAVSSAHAGLRQLIGTCLNKKPLERPTMQQVVEQLEGLQRPSRPRGGRRHLWVLGLVAALTGAMALALLRPWYRTEPRSRDDTEVVSRTSAGEPPTLRNETLRNETKRNETKRSETKARQSVRPATAKKREPRPTRRVHRAHTTTATGRRAAHGRLNIQATDAGEPRSVVVVLDGQVVGETPLQLSRVAVGTHYLTAQHEAYRKRRRVVRVGRGESRTVLFRLQKRPAGAN